jgi:excisionase family DNA binding protein
MPVRPELSAASWSTSSVRPDPFVVSIPEAAKLLGISKDLAYDLARRGELPGALRLGRRWRVSLVRLRQALHGPEHGDAQDARHLPVAIAVVAAKWRNSWKWPSISSLLARRMYPLVRPSGRQGAEPSADLLRRNGSSTSSTPTNWASSRCSAWRWARNPPSISSIAMKRRACVLVGPTVATRWRTVSEWAMRSCRRAQLISVQRNAHNSPRLAPVTAPRAIPAASTGS